jgi:hypothetical protein
MRIQSIRTVVEIRHPTGNRFLRPPGEMPLGKMNRIAKAHHIAQKIRTMTKALKDPRHLLAAGMGPPFVVHCRNVAGRFRVLDHLDFGLSVRHVFQPAKITIAKQSG